MCIILVSSSITLFHSKMRLVWRSDSIVVDIGVVVTVRDLCPYEKKRTELRYAPRPRPRPLAGPPRDGPPRDRCEGPPRPLAPTPLT